MLENYQDIRTPSLVTDTRDNMNGDLSICCFIATKYVKSFYICINEIRERITRGFVILLFTC
jgi:hypothetical protein